MNIPVPERPAVADPSLEPYAQLLRALLPRMNSVSVFNALGELHWSSEMSVEPALMALLPETIRTAETEPAGNGEQRMAGSEPTYLFWLRRDDGADPPTPFAVVAICFKPGNADADLRAFSFVHALVKPGIECLRRELMARDKILNLNSSLLEQDNDLDMLLSITGGTDNKPESAGDFKAIVTRATEHLKVGLSALIVPEKGIALVQVSAESPIDTSILAKAHRHLLSMAQMRHKATIVNRMVLTVGTVPTAYRVLVCPVLRADGNTMGVLALFRTESAPEFTPHYARLTELLASRVATIIGHSYDALTSLLTRPAFEQRVGSALQEVSGTRALLERAVDRHQSHARDQRQLRHAHGRSRDRPARRADPQPPAAGSDRGAYLGRPLRDPAAGGAAGRRQVRRGAARRGRGSGRGIRRRQDAGLGQHRRVGGRSAARRNSCMPSRPPRPPARPPTTAAAIASSCTRRRTRASCAASPILI